MKIPDTVRIAGVNYPVDFVPSLNDGEKLLYGQVDFEQTCIRLNPDVAGHQHQCITLWHEILHALINNAHIRMERDKEEEIVEALSLVAFIWCCRITVRLSLIWQSRRRTNLHRREPDSPVTPGGIADVYG